MAKNDTFGWDLLYKVTEPQIRNNHDIIICLTHWKLIHQGFRCVGVGEDTTQPHPEEQSEILPEGWNASNKYTLRYIHNGKLYLLNAIKNNSNMVINLNRICDNHATGTCIDVDVVKERHGPLAKLIPTYEELITRIKKNIIEPMFEVVPCREVQTQTPSEVSQPPPMADPRRSDSYFVPPPRDLSHPSRSFFNDPLGVGRADLDPFATGGGGMLFQPPGFGPRLPGPGFDPHMPRGSVPPGARFDPFRPPGSGGPPSQPRSLNPDHDHLPPPGYDDMFM